MAVVAIPAAVAAGFQWWQVPAPEIRDEALVSAFRRLTNANLSTFAACIAKVIVLGLAGAYLVKGGRAICRLAGCRQDESQPA
jgi:hypothetical protein